MMVAAEYVDDEKLSQRSFVSGNRHICTWLYKSALYCIGNITDVIPAGQIHALSIGFGVWEASKSLSILHHSFIPSSHACPIVARVLPTLPALSARRAAAQAHASEGKEWAPITR